MEVEFNPSIIFESQTQSVKISILPRVLYLFQTVSIWREIYSELVSILGTKMNLFVLC